MSTPDQTVGKRPISVAFVAAFIILYAFVQLLAVGLAVMLMLRPGEQQTLYGHSVSDFYWIATGMLSLIMALIYFWIAKTLLGGNPQAWLLVNFLAAINIVFAVFQLPFGTGYAAIVINLIVLLLNNTAAARNWYASNTPTYL